MAQSFRLKRFSNVALLKRIDFGLLSEFFGAKPQFVAFLQDHGIVCTHDPEAFDFDRLARLLMTPDAATPEDFLDALYFVDQLAEAECADRLVEELERRHVALPGGAYAPEDLALRAWLVDPNILQRLHAEQHRTRPAKFQSFFGAEARALPAPAAATLAALEASLNDYFEFKKKGRGARVFPFAEPEAVWFLVRHGQRMTRQGTVRPDEASGSVFYRPEKFDVLIYYPATGELAIHADTKGEQVAYCRAWGQHLFGSAAFFGLANPPAKYTLAPLLENREAALVCSDVAGLQAVHLVELALERDSDQFDVEIRRADDVFRALNQQGRQLADEADGVRPIRAKFRVRFDCGKERTVVLEPPHTASFDRDADSEIVHAWLAARGFICRHHPEETGHDARASVLAHA